uniref:Uncharacterized protein n=1 Tax=Mycena chlorophos TaxID=658473 RepID=A0ABQ0M0Q4_MYCCL|nr:predicted protein [Mycena chlorophos]
MSPPPPTYVKAHSRQGPLASRPPTSRPACAQRHPVQRRLQSHPVQRRLQPHPCPAMSSPTCVQPAPARNCNSSAVPDSEPEPTTRATNGTSVHAPTSARPPSPTYANATPRPATTAHRHRHQPLPQLRRLRRAPPPNSTAPRRAADSHIPRQSTRDLAKLPVSSVRSPLSHTRSLPGQMVGTSIDLLLQGVLSCQFVNYYSLYSDDKWQLHAAVGFLALSTWLKSVQAFAVIWIKFIEYYGNFVGAFELSVSRGSWWDSGNALMGSAIGL